MTNFSYYNKIIQAFTLALFAIAGLFSFAFAQPLNAKIYTNTLNAKVGDTITIRLMVNPDYDNPVYTVSATLMYDPTLLEYSDTVLSNDLKLLPLPKNPYILTDTENGMIRRTAGYANGVNTLANFTTYTFKAVKAGEAKISVEDGIALDINNVDIGLQQKFLTINITEDDGSEELSPESFNLDLNLNILGPTAIYKEESYTFPIDRVVDANMQDLDIRVYVYNTQAELFYTERQTFTSYDVEPVFFTIPPNTLPIGDYLISAEVIDENGNKTVVAQKNIGVLANNKYWIVENRDYIIPIVMFITLIAYIHHVMRDRELYDKIKEFSKINRRKKVRK